MLTQMKAIPGYNFGLILEVSLDEVSIFAQWGLK